MYLEIIEVAQNWISILLNIVTGSGTGEMTRSERVLSIPWIFFLSTLLPLAAAVLLSFWGKGASKIANIIFFDLSWLFALTIPLSALSLVDQMLNGSDRGLVWVPVSSVLISSLGALMCAFFALKNQSERGNYIYCYKRYLSKQLIFISSLLAFDAIAIHFLDEYIVMIILATSYVAFIELSAKKQRVV